MEHMNRKIGIGVVWNLSGLLIGRGSTVLFTLILARLLTPESFGLIAMMMIVLELAQHFVQSGLGQALVRSKNVSQQDLSTIFYTNLGLSAIAYAVIYFTAPHIANFYVQPELTKLLQATGLVVVFGSVKIVPTAIQSRKMNFRSQMTAETLGALISGVMAVTLAILGAEVWSLAAQILTASLISALTLWFLTRWLPSPSFSLDSFKRLFGFGANILAEGIIRIAVENSYVLVIAKAFSAEATGLYFLAKKVSRLVSNQLTAAVQKATFPAMATLQDDDTQLKNKYRQIIQIMMFAITPIMALLAALAQPLFDLLLGKEWSGAVIYLQLLCIVAALYPLHSMNINILNVKGRSDLVLKTGIFKNTLSLTILFATLPFGVFWIVIGQVVNSFLSLVPNTYYTARLISYGFKEQITDIFKPILAATVGCGGALLSSNALQIPDLARIALGGATGLTMFLLTCKLIKVEALSILASRYNLALLHK